MTTATVSISEVRTAGLGTLTTAEIMATVGRSTTVERADHAEPDVDRYADCARVWCDVAAGMTRVVDGFCECCGAQEHDCA